QIWGWKDPRNSLTLPFWEDLLPGLKTLMIVRNPLEVAYSMGKRNSTSYAFGLRLWEIYNRRLIETASEHERLVTHYDVFFENPENELRRIANFIGMPDAKVRDAAKLVATRRRHTHFTIDQLIDARVSEELIDLYRALIAAASATKEKGSLAKSDRRGKSDEVDLLPGAVSRLNAFVPDRLAQIEHLYGELLAQAEARHKEQVEELMCRHRTEVEQFNVVLGKAEARHKAQSEALTSHLDSKEEQYKTHIEELTTLYTNEIEQLRQRIVEMNALLHLRSVNLAEDEKYIAELTDRLRKQLQNTRRLSRLLEDAEDAACKLRTSRRWQLANPGATLKAKLAHRKSPAGYGHLEKIVAAYSTWRKEHPEIKKIDDEIKAAQVAKFPRSGQAGTDGQAPASVPREELLAMPVGPVLPLKSICFPQHEEVEVSIIIPVFNQLEYTRACLASLQAVDEQTHFEVIIVDDCSIDSTANALPQIGGINYLRNERNSGFVASCNRGAKQARGKYLVFLNNDTSVKHGWLTALLDTFTQEGRARIGGSR